MSTVAALVVTNRPQFIPWWKHQIEKQTRQPDVVIIVDNCKDMSTPWLAGGCQGPLGNSDPHGPFFYTHHFPPATSLGELRQAALDAATSDIVLWFDDDDWYHPRRVELLAKLIEDGHADAAAMPLTHFLYLDTLMLYPVPGSVGLHLPATAWRRSSVAHVPFPAQGVGEDDVWVRRIMGFPPKGQPNKPRGRASILYDRVEWVLEYLEPNIGAMVLSHGQNTFQRAAPSPANLAVMAGEPLYSLPPKDVSRAEWQKTWELLRNLQSAARSPSV
jgi:glycosyltransferase involved in cell wall biosynthesis